MTSTKIFVHTNKAVLKGHPGDRVFLVVSEKKEGRKQRYLAYKCTLTPKGLSHPGYKGILSFDKVASGKGRKPCYPNYALPTADFKNDSFYQEVDVAELKARASKPN